MSSFVGVDGHTYTAELRPPASRHVSMLLYHIAQGLSAADDALTKPMGLFAKPMVGEEPLGGHIHLSFYPQTPPLGRVLWAKYGAILGLEGRLAQHLVGVPELSNELLEQADKVAPELFSMRDFARKLNWLVLALEVWAQPWHSRRNRNGRYGDPNDVRVVGHPVGQWPMGSLADKYPYMHLEYRPPSSWLAHPRLAYLYLALAKLVMLNYDAVPANDNDWRWAYGNNMQLDRARDLLFERWASRSWRTSADLRAIGENLRWLDENRGPMWQSGGQIDMEAWRQLWGGSAQLLLPADVNEDDPTAPHPEPTPAADDDGNDDDLELDDDGDDDYDGDDDGDANYDNDGAPVAVTVTDTAPVQFQAAAMTRTPIPGWARR